MGFASSSGTVLGRYVDRDSYVLVVGGAGYIGSHMSKLLSDHGLKPIILDRSSDGGLRVDRFGEFVVGDMADRRLLKDIFNSYKISTVFHFAALSVVGSSITHPADYYQNNLAKTLVLLDSMRDFEVNNIIFSSTAAIFGEPIYVPIDESHPKRPVNPYGASKLMVESVLADYADAYGLSSVSLRYFNACGAEPDSGLGEDHYPETHLIPIALQAALGLRPHLEIFGTDYPTTDGTCVRDYVHVTDLCAAHFSAYRKLVDGSLKGASCFNLGNGDGFSVKQVVDVVRSIVAEDGLKLHVVEREARVGDPSVLIADSKVSRHVLDWIPKYRDLDSMVRHAWAWEKSKQGIIG